MQDFLDLKAFNVKSHGSFYFWILIFLWLLISIRNADAKSASDT